MTLINQLINQQQQQNSDEKPPEQTNWVQNLISQRYQPKSERLKRTPIGFNFQQNPFDPSIYYKELGTFRSLSQNATEVAKTEQANKQASILQAQYAANQQAQQDALNKLGATAGSPGASVGVALSKGQRNYGLKGVSALTGKAANYWGSLYGIKTIGGYREHGSVPGSDHPKGRALDFMINNMKNGHNTGTALANDLVKNYKAWNIKYVIWNRYIWTPSQGWHRYNGPSPHTDHVHASFNK